MSDLLKLEMTPEMVAWTYKAVKSVGYVQGYDGEKNAELLLAVMATLRNEFEKWEATQKKEAPKEEVKENKN